MNDIGQAGYCKGISERCRGVASFRLVAIRRFAAGFQTAMAERCLHRGGW
jgi:hypothetical protein